LTLYIERSLRHRLASAAEGDAQHPLGQRCSDVSSVDLVHMQIISGGDGVHHGFGRVSMAAAEIGLPSGMVSAAATRNAVLIVSQMRTSRDIP
jgi:hypothetical protein